MTQVVLSEIHGKVGLIRINRPEALNALNNDVVDGIGAAIDAFEEELRRILGRARDAADGEQAVAKAAELRPDVVVMDIAMPQRDGLDVLRQTPQFFELTMRTRLDGEFGGRRWAFHEPPLRTRRDRLLRRDETHPSGGA